ncbi:hypothetical protein [Yoonia sp. 2307UL14-13]|uniref:hypothetical protein n=1 Tax=Yoonia sp. 2307UL14-13 TaxID=3126506 RepID=UPI00309AAA92
MMNNLHLIVAASLLCALSFVYASNTSEHELPRLPQADGWVYAEIEDAWTVRPIGVDGKIPADADMDDVIRRHSSFLDSDSFGDKMEKQSRLDDGAKRCDAARAAAHYTREGAAFNMVVERLPDCFSDPGSSPVEMYIVATTRAFAAFAEIVSGRAAIERFKQMIPHRTIAGIEFRTLPAALRSSQVAAKEADLNIEGFVGQSIVRIWGVGDDEDVEDLLLSLDKSLQRYAGE